MRRAIGSVLLACLFLLLSGRSALAGGVRVGDGLPAVTLFDWQGGAVDLAALRPRVMIVDFWASWCLPCREALPELNAIGQRHAAAGLQVVAVNIDKARAAAETFLQSRVPTPAMTLLHDPTGAALARYGAAGMPALYVVDQRGVVRLVESGFTVEELRSVEQLVARLLADSEAP
jgi:cytochrome c biogenesis protein CcmG/thiol:disulfide interchange protein DsbE